MTSMIDIAAWTAASALLHKITSMIATYGQLQARFCAIVVTSMIDSCIHGQLQARKYHCCAI